LFEGEQVHAANIISLLCRLDVFEGAVQAGDYASEHFPQSELALTYNALVRAVGTKTITVATLSNFIKTLTKTGTPEEKWDRVVAACKPIWAAAKFSINESSEINKAPANLDQKEIAAAKSKLKAAQDLVLGVTKEKSSARPWGILHYPLTAALIKWGNSGVVKDVLTRICQELGAGLNLNQLYIKRNGIKFSYELKRFDDEVNTFRLAAFVSSRNPVGNRLGFQLVTKKSKVINID
jgi:hypothetical protein